MMKSENLELRHCMEIYERSEHRHSRRWVKCSKHVLLTANRCRFLTRNSKLTIRSLTPKFRRKMLLPSLLNIHGLSCETRENLFPKEKSKQRVFWCEEIFMLQFHFTCERKRKEGKPFCRNFSKFMLKIKVEWTNNSRIILARNCYWITIAAHTDNIQCGIKISANKILRRHSLVGSRLSRKFSDFVTRGAAESEVTINFANTLFCHLVLNVRISYSENTAMKNLLMESWRKENVMHIYHRRKSLQKK